MTAHGTFDEIPEEMNPVHLLLIAPTKYGKSTYAARAALDGFRLIYIDSDNGASALAYQLNNNDGGEEAKKRVHYFRTSNPTKLLGDILGAGIVRWNVTKSIPFVSTNAANSPTDTVVEIKPAKIPPQIVLVVDSWTSVAWDAMELGATANAAELENLGAKMEAVYGTASAKLNVIAAVIQGVKFHVIVQAHNTVYERYVKPIGSDGSAKRRDMILADTTEIPLSSSRPHGLQMGKYFNYIGWIGLKQTGETTLDFTRRTDRVGGGPPNKVDLINNLSMKNLVGKAVDPGTDGWITTYTVQEFLDAKAAKDSPKAASPSLSSGATVNKQGIQLKGK